MAKIGFDWGTTTTSISFFQPEKNSYDYLRFGGSNLNTFPSVIAYRTSVDGNVTRRIGEAARKVIYSKKYDTYDNLKLNLNSTAKNLNGRQRSIYEAVRDFIGTTIGEYVYIYKNPPEGIVFTVPDSWGKDIFQHPSLMLLEQIISDIGFDTDTQITFCSEPVAAAAYYCKEICDEKFSGALLVVDLGGGTIDLTLCKVERADRILVVKRCGETGETFTGCSGEAFDFAVAKKISDDNDLNLTSNQPKFFKLKHNFESAKISAAANVDRLLREYYSATTEKRKFFAANEAVSVTYGEDEDEYSVTVGDIVETFNAVNRRVLEKYVREMLACCTDEKIPTEDAKNFRVILTGGFSNLYCVEATVRQIFGAPLCGADARFDLGINRELRSTATAHGAAIIAEGNMSVDVLFQKNAGFFYFDVFGDEKRKATLLKSRDLVRNIREPIYFNRTLSGKYIDENSFIAIFIEDGQETFNFDIKLDKLCPAKERFYTLGLSLGRRQTLFLHSLDDNGAHVQIPVGIS